MQDRIIAKASANASDSRGRSDAVEKTLYLHQAGGLGFCKQALSRPKTVLGPGDAGAAAAFVVPLNVGRLHAGSNAREVCSAGGGDVASPFFR